MKKLRNVICALFGHSKIHTNCIGYKYCARCGTQVGDSLGGVYSNKTTVLIGHGDCEDCKRNYYKMNWKHKIFLPKEVRNQLHIDGIC